MFIIKVKHIQFNRKTDIFGLEYYVGADQKERGLSIRILESRMQKMNVSAYVS